MCFTHRKTYSLFSLQSTLLPVNQELQTVTQLALGWLHCQLLGILKKTKTNYMKLPSLTKSCCRYTRPLGNFADVPASTSGTSSPTIPWSKGSLFTAETTVFTQQNTLPLLTYPKQVQLFAQWRKNKKLKLTNCQDTPLSQCTCKWPLVQQHLSVNRTVGTTQTPTQQSSKGPTCSSTCR